MSEPTPGVPYKRTYCMSVQAAITLDVSAPIVTLGHRTGRPFKILIPVPQNESDQSKLMGAMVHMYCVRKDGTVGKATTSAHVASLSDLPEWMVGPVRQVLADAYKITLRDAEWSVW